jgi:hypothetical protein
MSAEYIRQIAVKKDGVYLTSKSSNDDRPYHEWRCDSLTDIYNAEGQLGLDREIVQMFCEYAAPIGKHSSIMRYLPCLEAANRLAGDHVRRLNMAYEELDPKDRTAYHRGKEFDTPKSAWYRAVSKAEYKRYYTDLAHFAGSKQPVRESGGAR